MKFNTYLFDFDGTLVDSMPAFISVMLRILNENNIEYESDIIKIITPLGYVGTAKYYREKLGIEKSEQELLEIMERHKGDGLRGVFHCFGGSKETAERMLRHEGFVLGIGGVLTFKNCRLAETLRHVPLDRIVLETDAPYLAPVPFRGKRNEPAFVAYVAQFLSNIYNVSEQEIGKVTNSTVNRLFGFF